MVADVDVAIFFIIRLGMECFSLQNNKKQP